MCGVSVGVKANNKREDIQKNHSLIATWFVLRKKSTKTQDKVGIVVDSVKEGL